MKENNYKTPIWHDTAIKLIRFAEKFKHTNNEFERQVGYLLLDVGVETLFRSYLTMPESKLKLAYSKREEAAKGKIDKKDIPGDKLTLASFDELSFHKLVEAVGKVVEPNIDENILKEVEHYHNIRNKIYHLGEGIVPAKEKFDGYLLLAGELLSFLVNKNQQDKKVSNPDNSTDAIMEALRIAGLDWALGSLRQDFQELKLEIAVAAEVVSPKLTTRRIEAGLKELLRDEDINSIDLEIKEKFDEQQTKIKEFQKLTGIITEDVTFIDGLIYDITYMYLSILLAKKKIEIDDINKYLEYRDFVEKFGDAPDKATMEDKEKLSQLRDWARTFMRKLYDFYKDQASDQE